MKNEKTIMSVTELVKVIAEKTKKTQKDIREIIDVISDIVADEINTVTPDNDVEVKVFPGLSVLGTYKDAHEARNPRTGETVMVAGAIKAKGVIGKQLKDSLNV